MVNVCIPVLRRYDLLRRLLDSLTPSTIPYRVYVIDNGRDAERMGAASVGFQVTTFTPPQAMGVAESWNWFIDNVPEERVIMNDDITCVPDSLERLTASAADLVWASSIGFSCFIIRDRCVEKIGKFDEMISPGYGYYEDEDYLQRLDGRGTRTPSAVAENVECGVLHEHSATLKAAPHNEILEHHRKFLLARHNYIKKWNLEETFR